MLLFVILMDGLHFMLRKAADLGLLQLLARSGLHYRTSIYADDMVTFIKPERASLLTYVAIVQDFR